MNPSPNDFTAALQIFGYTALAGLALCVILRFFRKPKSLLIDFLKNWVGSLYIFSGAVKAIDPLGTAYKMHDYFEALHLTFFNSYATAIAVTMIVFEIVLGLALIIGWKPRLSTSLSFLMIIFFTFLTGYTYLNGFVNPDYFNAEAKASAEAAGQKVKMIVAFNENFMKVKDCGCFGDFLKLHPKVSFLKDCVLLIITLILFVRSKAIEPALKSNLLMNVKMAAVFAISLLFCFRNFMWNEPIVDFRPYKAGSNIQALMQSGRPPVSEFVFIYKNNASGKEEEIKTADLMKYDLSQYSYVDRREKIIDPGIPAKITDFIITDENNMDIAPTVLTNPSYTFIVTASKFEKGDEADWKKLNELALANKNTYDFFAAAHMDDTKEGEAFKQKIKAAFPIYTCDEKVLKTITRSNPGLVLMKNGVVVNKWHANHFPSWDELTKKYLK